VTRDSARPGRFRPEVRPGDVAAVGALVAGTGRFRPAEVAIAAELVAECLARGPEASGYHFLLADGPGGDLRGYACFGPIAGTLHSFDLYWIAVDAGAQGRGLGRHLLAATEAAILEAGGRRLYADTSATPAYAPTRAFYAACGFAAAAELPDFYAPGDGKVIVCKALDP
jgi:GNAT superfamily N-acetyltransferase